MLLTCALRTLTGHRGSTSPVLRPNCQCCKPISKTIFFLNCFHVVRFLNLGMLSRNLTSLRDC